ncbi:MAG: agmatine deiminase family protein [bacterium]|nr:agmatine deiminase family protein [bacterium]
MAREFPFRFGYIPYPLWRRRYPIGIKQAFNSVYPALYPVFHDQHPPTTSAQIAQFLKRFKLLPSATPNFIEQITPPILPTQQNPIPPQPSTKIRLIAQWEPLEAVLMSWCVFYPRLWSLHAAMVAGIIPVAEVHIAVPSEWWARAIWAYLGEHDFLGDFAHHVKFLILPTDDVWIRDYGPMLGYDEAGVRGGVKAIYDHLPFYPQGRDNAMPMGWSAQSQTPLTPLNLHIEGGNLLTDGAGTLFMTAKVLKANPQFPTQSDLEAYLHTVLDYDKLIITPYMKIERTGHIDLLMKLLDDQTVMLSTPSSKWDTARLDEVGAIFRSQTNAKGEKYHIIEMPTPPLFFNWIVYPIRRSYTNALTVNGRILVPIYKSASDDTAIRLYEQYAKGYDIIPLDCSVMINGGGAIHCMTREVPI